MSIPEFKSPMRIVKIEAFACRCPIEVPVETSFGVMRDRPAVFVRIEDDDGCFGWGEAFANWPSAGAEHRVNLLIDDVSDLVFSQTWSDPVELFNTLTHATHIRALQCGEWGPFRQVISALDIAAWDLSARKSNQSVACLLNANAATQVPAYASGIHIDAAPMLVAKARTIGFTAFKVKVGFDDNLDAKKLLHLAGNLQSDERLFADANQAWNVSTAEAFLQKTKAAKLGWIEEPIAADAKSADWQKLAKGAVPLAGGENIAGRDDFEAALNFGALQYIQPDVIKWGGLTACRDVAIKALNANRIYCPHFLGGGIGLAASAHLLAAVAGPGLLEVDINPNPLRDSFGTAVERMSNGNWDVGSGIGLGVERLPEEVSEFTTLHRLISA